MGIDFNKKNYLIELVGTFILVYAITSAATVYSKSGQHGVIGIGLVHAFVLTAIVFAIGYKSGAHVNPAVTVAFLITKRMRISDGIFYVIFQIIGGIMAAAVVFAIFGSSISSSVTLPSDGNVLRAFILETVMTFTLVYIVLTTAATASNKIGPLAGLAIGLTLGFNVIFGGSISGGSLNPARSFGPALITGNLIYNWIYWIAPIMGSLIAAGIHRLLHTEQDP
ncbi:MAG TPA: aquaporin [Verrucomicrobiae bacterium]|nr:aquaporin [Verrucomicrobiae bacterium]